MTETKECPKCERVLPMKKFHLCGGGRRRMHCNECYGKRYKNTHGRNWRLRKAAGKTSTAKARAANAVKMAVRTGKLLDPGVCAICEGLMPGFTCEGTGRLEWHHHDTTYAKENDLNVVRLHSSGHRRIHMAMRRVA